MNRFLLLCYPLFFIGCLSTSSFEPSKATEFRYKNSYNQTLFLPKNIKVCLVNTQKNLPKIHTALEKFIQTQWQENAIIEKNCQNSDFAFYLYTTKDYYGSFFRTIKLSLIEHTNQKLVANYTVYSTHLEKENLDNEETLNAFASLFLTSQKMFNE